jgi:hypothetical protein
MYSNQPKHPFSMESVFVSEKSRERNKYIFAPGGKLACAVLTSGTKLYWYCLPNNQLDCEQKREI